MGRDAAGSGLLVESEQVVLKVQRGKLVRSPGVNSTVVSAL
jgi:hypothetical protein